MNKDSHNEQVQECKSKSSSNNLNEPGEMHELFVNSQQLHQEQPDTRAKKMVSGNQHNQITIC